MTLSASDIVVLPYDSQFSRAGVEYARRALQTAYNRSKLTSAEALRKVVSGVAFEMAARRWLESQSIQYNRLGAAAYTNPNRFTLAIGGRRCDLRGSLIDDKGKIVEFHKDAGWALEAIALIPEEQFDADWMEENDIYLFGFVTGLEARHSTDSQKALAKGLPADLVHLPPAERWGGNGGGQPWGEVALKSNAESPIEVEIVGQGINRELIRESVILQPHLRTALQHDYHAVLYLHTAALPEAAIGLHSPALSQTHLIEPGGWANIWLYGQRVYLCGWLNKHDFREQSQRLPPYSSIKQRRPTTVSSRALPVNELRPMAELTAIAPKGDGPKAAV